MRLTLDYDYINEKRLEKKINLLRVLFPGRRIYKRTSASGNGYHVKVHGVCKSMRENLHLRYWLGDDYKRICMDAERVQIGFCSNVLFTKKSTFGEVTKATKWKLM